MSRIRTTKQVGYWLGALALAVSLLTYSAHQLRTDVAGSPPAVEVAGGPGVSPGGGGG